MSKNEVVKENEKNDSVETSETLNENQVQIVNILDPVVKLAKFTDVKSKYGVRHPFFVTLKTNDVKIEFEDKEGFYDYLMAFKNCGEKDYVKSKHLVEEAKYNEEGEVERTFICMRYELADGSIIRLFPKQFNAGKIIKKYFDYYMDHTKK